MKPNEYGTEGSLNHLKSLAKLKQLTTSVEKELGSMQIVREERGHIHQWGKNQTQQRMKVIKRSIQSTYNLCVCVSRCM